MAKDRPDPKVRRSSRLAPGEFGHTLAGSELPNDAVNVVNMTRNSD